MHDGGADLGCASVAVVVAAMVLFLAHRRWRRLAWLAAKEAEAESEIKQRDDPLLDFGYLFEIEQE